MDRVRILVLCALVGVLTACGAPPNAAQIASPSAVGDLASPAAPIDNVGAAPAATETTAATFPLTVENCGFTLTVEQPPQRVVTTALNVTELLLALGLQDRIAGAVNPGDRLLPQYQAAFSGVNVIAERAFPPPSREVILAADPDLIMSGFADDWGPQGFGTRAELQADGINSYLLRGSCGEQPATIVDTYADIELLGGIFDVPDQARTLIERMQAEAQRVPPAATPVRAFNYDSGEDQPFTTGRNGLLNDLIEQAGGEHIFSDVGQAYFTASWEEIVARDPEVIIVTASSPTPNLQQIDAETQQKIDFLRSNPQLATISAIRNNRIVVLDITSQVPSVRNGTAIATLAEAFRQ
jgi:iron complex transport system substrate-binding protein